MNNNFKDKSTEQLRSYHQLSKSVVIALSVVLLLLVVVSTYGLIVKDNNATFISLFTVAISCAAVIPIQLMSMKKIKEEIHFRESEVSK